LERIGRSDRIAAGVSTSNPAERRQEDGWRPDGRDAMASTRTAAAATALTATLGLAAASWVVGSSIGLMLMLVALGAMSVNSMSVIASLVLAQKLLQPRAAIDVPLALVIVGLGILINDRKEKR
jgi:hypothetical protein